MSTQPETVDPHEMRVAFAGQLDHTLDGVTQYLARGDQGNALLLLTQAVREIGRRMSAARPISIEEVWDLEATIGGSLTFLDPPNLSKKGASK